MRTRSNLVNMRTLAALAICAGYSLSCNAEEACPEFRQDVAFPNSSSTHVVELTPDGKTIVFNAATQVIVADVESGKILQSLDRGVGNPALLVNHVAIADDASTVLAGHEDGRLCLWDVASGDLVSCVSGGTEYTETQNQIRYLPTNRYATLRVTASVSVQYIDALTGERTNSLNMLPGVLMDVSPDGGRVLVNRDIRDAGTGSTLLTLDAPGKAEIHNQSYRFSRDGSRVIRARETILVWDAATGELLVEQPSPLTTPGSWDSDGSVLVLGGGHDDPIVVADVDTLATLYTIPAGDGFVADWVAISADGSRFAVAQKVRTRVYDTADGSLVQEFIHGTGTRYSADLSTNVSAAHRWNGDDPVNSDAYPRDLLVVRRQGEEPLVIPTEADHDLLSIGISRDGDLLASWEEEFVVVRDTLTGTPVDSAFFGSTPGESYFPLLDFSPDNRYLRYQWDARTMLFDMQDDLTRNFNADYKTAFLPGSPTRMLRASGNTVEIFQVETLTAGDAFTIPGDVNVLASSNAAERFLVALTGDGGTAVYDATDGSLLQDFAALAGEGWSGFALSDDGTRALLSRSYTDEVIASTNGETRQQLISPIAVADVASGEIIQVFDYPSEGASRFSPDGKSIVFEGYAGMVLPIEECAPEGEGAVEGSAEGEGTEEGTAEGSIEGTPEGQVEGTTEGAAEGEGTSEGVVEGEPEGSVEGGTEGSLEGDPEGNPEGSTEGAEEGESNVAAARLTLLALPGLDFNQDGKLDESEYAGMQSGSPEEFEALDLNGDGALSLPELLRHISANRPVHNSDTNGDGRIAIGELLRLIQFYNAGGYDCTADPDDTEDGYLPDGDAKLSTGCPAHAADYLNSDGVIDLTELLRLIQLYNLGNITPCESSEDGFCAAA